MANTELLYLSMDDVESLGITYGQCIEVIEATLAEHYRGEVELPEKQALHPQPGCFTHGMSARVPALNGMGMKYVSYKPGNFFENGFPDSTALLVLNEGDTMHPICVMEAMWLTYLRTACMAAVAAKHCANITAERIALIGVGGLARWGLPALESVLPHLKEVKGFDLKTSAFEQFEKDMAGRTRCRITKADSVEEALEEAEVVLCATPRPSTPFIKEAWWKPGCTAIPLNGIACWEPECFAKADRLISDRITSYENLYARYPDLTTSSKPYELSAVVTGNKSGRERPEERVMMISEGIGIVDVTVGRLIYNMAKEKGLGQKLPFMRRELPLPPRMY